MSEREESYSTDVEEFSKSGSLQERYIVTIGTLHESSETYRIVTWIDTVSVWCPDVLGLLNRPASYFHEISYF